jgi:putative endonuclease
MAFFVYMLASRRNGTLYTGVTGHLAERVHQHKAKRASGFTARYGVDRLVWYEAHDDPSAAIQRETSIKRWPRAWKINVIVTMNPEWRDLYEELNC